ncbi:nitric oxide synthase oxygenase [Amycolatopsis keratiniphila subsp. keratiniphila]|uniref:Nitric oxide synthase oxygenase n=1 Tax=Amycolatopsis keratiniphila subsp. keratiniphila TaxID=227715 RepID=A0A1W2M4D1_9PSEU|nr:nitric oxide synthase oxygenase [Amycolatopsis keratiniphila subsp. keratiniphila]
MRQYYRECAPAETPEPRIRRVIEEIDETGTYTHTPEELRFGTKVAWRNAGRCLGRLYWQSLVVRDLRHVREPEQIAAECVAHLKQAHNGGRIRSIVSVFAPDRPGRPGPRILSEQLIRYAGVRTGEKTWRGDPRNAALTDRARAAGWTASVDRFTPLPLLIQPEPAAAVRWFGLPPGAVVEVPITHPVYRWFAGLGARWYTVAAVSHLALEIGGVCYPSAPQNGWYVVTEVGARNLGDEHRYHLLPAIAERLGLDIGTDASLWRDRALVELNLAVLHSFRAAGVTMGDHHTESRRFLQHLDRERRAGRTVPTDWSWTVPPISGSATPVFHRYYDPVPADLRPAFVARTPW